MELINQHRPISLWADEDKPREKLMLKGRHTLSNSELISILLGTGSKGSTALETAKDILQRSNGSLMALSRLGVEELQEVRGVGMAKAVTLVAALELGRRRRSAEIPPNKAITGSRDAFEIAYEELSDSHHEKFAILLLNRANRLIRKVVVSEGGFSGTVADPKRIFSAALAHKASSIILAHNHPSGNVRPSDSDVQLTHKLQKAGEHLDLPILDHLIVGDENYFSFADEGMI
jgi:DNA repair protein RadC